MKAHGFDLRGTFKGQRVPTLPSWTSADEGREIFVEDENKKYYGGDSDWVDYSTVETSAYAETLIENWPYNNLMPDNGRFAGDVGQSLYTGSFVNSTFWAPYNSGNAADAGEFIHNNTTYGGSQGALTVTVQDLVETMGRTGSDLRYGVEFFVCQLNCGSGTSIPGSFPGGTRYLMTTNGARAYWGNYGWSTTTGWFRAINGPIGFRGDAYVNFKIDGVLQATEEYDLSPSAGWVFMQFSRQDPIGYSNGHPYIYGNNGNSLQVAIPAIFNGYIRDIIYTAPLVSR